MHLEGVTTRRLATVLCVITPLGRCPHQIGQDHWCQGLVWAALYVSLHQDERLAAGRMFSGIWCCLLEQILPPVVVVETVTLAGGSCGAYRQADTAAEDLATLDADAGPPLSGQCAVSGQIAR